MSICLNFLIREMKIMTKMVQVELWHLPGLDIRNPACSVALGAVEFAVVTTSCSGSISS